MNKLSKYELFFLSVINTCAVFPGIYTSMSINKANTMTIFGVLIGFILSISTIIIIYFLKKKYKEINIKNKSILIKLISILIILVCISIYFINSWSIINFFISQLLTRNSYYVITIVFFFIVIYLANKDIVVIGRTSIILMFISTIFSFIAILSLISKINIYNFLPLFTTSKNNFLKVILYSYTLSSAPLIPVLILNNCKDRSLKTILLGYLIGTVLIITYLFFILAVYGVDLASLAYYPGYFLLKNIKIFNFIERVENILIAIYINNAFINFATISHYYKSTFNKKIFIGLSLLIPIISIYCFKNYDIRFIYNYIPYLLGLLIIIIIVLSLLSIIKKTIRKKTL